MRTLLLAAALVAAPLHAATLDVEVKDVAGKPLVDAVVYAIPKGPPPALRKRDVAVQQVDKAFVPLVTVVQTGTAVTFPNRDPIRHHVYSFSAPKPFELKLYAGTPASPIVFDKPGEVVLGCNIHDTMLAWILVVDTPFFGKSAANGHVKIDGLPAGDYDVTVWHPYQAAPIAAPKPVKLQANDNTALTWALTLRPR